MVDILPFRGLRYNLDKLHQEGASLDAVVSPPYDIIDEALQAKLMARHPANFVRVDLGPKTPQDHETDNPYTRAADLIRQWEADETLVPEPAPAFYAYSQTWTEPNGEVIERKGLLALVRLEDFESGQILPHEHTLKGPKQDRLQLMQATRCNLSPIFMIYSDPERLMEGLLYENAAMHLGWAQATDIDGVAHRFKPVTEAAAIERLRAMFAEKSLLIADGHHRYETALTLQAEVREQIRRQTGAEPPAGSLLTDYTLIFASNMEDPGLKVYPTHRILYDWPEGWDAARFEAELFKRYDVVERDETFRYRRAGGSERIPLRLKPGCQPDTLPPLLDTFDAALLSETIFQDMFNHSQEMLKNRHLLGFYRDGSAIDRLWESGEAVAGFYLAAPSVKLVHAICQSGHRMPQKSTYFYPKILSGLVLYVYRPFGNQPGHALGDVRPEARPLEPAFQFPQAVFSQRPY